PTIASLPSARRTALTVPRSAGTWMPSQPSSIARSARPSTRKATPLSWTGWQSAAIAARSAGSSPASPLLRKTKAATSPLPIAASSRSWKRCNGSPPAGRAGGEDRIRRRLAKAGSRLALVELHDGIEQRQGVLARALEGVAADDRAVGTARRDLADLFEHTLGALGG